MWTAIPAEIYADRIEGALLGRCAGCTLGAPVEGWPVAKMELLAKENDEPFPPKDYWQSVPNALELRYKVTPRRDYTRDGINGVPVDDDIVYTLLGLLIVENYGPDFTVADVGKAWIKYLPYACTAEEVALKNLKAGVPAIKAADRDNPYCEWIGADIRADPWGYLAPGWPEKAAELAWRDAYLSHRRQGIYGAMYFAAAISAAFTVNDPMEALRIGLSEIPAESAMAQTVRWALEASEDIATHSQARAAVDARFDGMHHVHTLNNACLTIFGIAIGGTDFARVIGETVAMGLDNDCTAATAGSIVGAVVGKAGIPKPWHARFNNTVHSYLNGRKKFSLSGLTRRFAQQASRVFGA
jgi:ADP-ribosylglycohydrolase